MVRDVLDPYNIGKIGFLEPYFFRIIFWNPIFWYPILALVPYFSGFEILEPLFSGLEILDPLLFYSILKIGEQNLNCFES